MSKSILFVLFCTLCTEAHASSFADQAGDYTISICSKTGASTAVDYCQYDELKISADAVKSAAIKFEFLKKGISLLSYDITEVASIGNSLQVQDSSQQQVILSSTDMGITSQTTIENFDEGKLLTLSSSGAGARNSYDFKLFLLPK